LVELLKREKEGRFYNGKDAGSKINVKSSPSDGRKRLIFLVMHGDVALANPTSGRAGFIRAKYFCRVHMMLLVSPALAFVFRGTHNKMAATHIGEDAGRAASLEAVIELGEKI
jgi:hypothetical protein